MGVLFRRGLCVGRLGLHDRGFGGLCRSMRAAGAGFDGFGFIWHGPKEVVDVKLDR
jgi:hypothetical protein